jgi:PIN domain nuclease of toxin-antitoxin system
MQRVVLDASAIMAFLYDEPGGSAVETLLLDEDAEICLSSVNLCEVVTLLTADGMSSEEISQNLEIFIGYLVDFNATMAMRAGELSAFTRSAGLSLGDRACLALAAEAGAIAWTADRAWKKFKSDIAIKLIRHE